MQVTCFHTFVPVHFQQVHACWTEVSSLACLQLLRRTHTHTHVPPRALPAQVKSKNRPVMLLPLSGVFEAHWLRDHIFIHRRRGWPRHAVPLRMLACLQPPKTCPYFTCSLSHPSYPQSPLPGTSACTRRRRRRRWQRGWPSAGWGKFLDKVPKHPPGSQCCEPTPTWRVWGLPSLKLRVRLKWISSSWSVPKKEIWYFRQQLG